MKQIAWIILILVSPALAAMAPKDFDLQVQIEAPPQTSLLRLRLPEDVYRAVRRADLGDLRIFNAAGEAVPMARLPRHTEVREQRIERPLLPLPTVATPGGGKLVVEQGVSGSNLRVEIDTQQGKPAAAVVPGYLLEVKDFDLRIDELILSWPEAITFEAAVQVRASDDLNRWSTVVRRAPLLAIGEGESHILQARVKLPAVKARYLRISWVGAAPAVSLHQATLIHKETSQETMHQWLTLDGEAKGDAIAYVSPGLFPVEMIRLMPVGDTDVLPATLYSRSTVRARWRWRTRTLGYRLRQNGEVDEGSPETISITHDPLWRVELNKGARSASVPRLQIGWVPDEVVFVARGTGPFTLAAGSASALPRWLTPAQVVPGFGSDTAAAIISAQIVTGTAPTQPVSRNLAPWQTRSNWLLWAVLALGVAVLGVMARGLWRDMRSDVSDDGGDER